VSSGGARDATPTPKNDNFTLEVKNGKSVNLLLENLSVCNNWHRLTQGILVERLWPEEIEVYRFSVAAPKRDGSSSVKH